jgi:hypothetical protein
MSDECYNDVYEGEAPPSFWRLPASASSPSSP